MKACRNHHTDIVKLLIKHGADFDKPDENNITPLYIACLNGHIDIVKLLIKLDADINRTTISGETLIDAAKSRNKTDTVLLLQNKMKKTDRLFQNHSTTQSIDEVEQTSTRTLYV